MSQRQQACRHAHTGMSSYTSSVSPIRNSKSQEQTQTVNKDDPWLCFGRHGQHGVSKPLTMLPFDIDKTGIWIGFYDDAYTCFGHNPSWDEIGKMCCNDVKDNNNNDDVKPFPEAKNTSHALHQRYFYCSGCINDDPDKKYEPLYLEQRRLLPGYMVCSQITMWMYANLTNRSLSYHLQSCSMGKPQNFKRSLATLLEEDIASSRLGVGISTHTVL